MSDFERVRAILDAATAEYRSFTAQWEAEDRADVVARNLAPELLAVAEAAERADTHHYETRLLRSDEPSDPVCGECGEDWPCPGSRVRAALDALHAKMKETLT